MEFEKYSSSSRRPEVSRELSLKWQWSHHGKPSSRAIHSLLAWEVRRLRNQHLGIANLARMCSKWKQTLKLAWGLTWNSTYNFPCYNLLWKQTLYLRTYIRQATGKHTIHSFIQFIIYLNLTLCSHGAAEMNKANTPLIAQQGKGAWLNKEVVC